MERHGIICEGEVRKTANINNIVPELVDDNLKRRFIAGLADTIGSTKRSHRRFNDDKQMVSFEISGFEFSFVCLGQLSSLSELSTLLGLQTKRSSVGFFLFLR